MQRNWAQWHRDCRVGGTEYQVFQQFSLRSVRTAWTIARFTQLMDGAFHAPTIGLDSMMRQLSYEAITVAVAAIRQRVEPQQEGQLKKLPPQERDERMKKQSAKITGFVIQGDYEPAHAVVDFFTTMLDECAPRYLPLSKCISREQELQKMKADKRIVVLEDQQLQVKNKAPETAADLSTDLKVQNAFVRRGLAGEQAGIFTYETHGPFDKDSTARFQVARHWRDSSC